MKQITAIVLLLTLQSNAAAFTGNSAPVLSGYVRNYCGILLSEDQHFSVLQNTANLSLDYRTGNGSFRISSWLHHHPSKELELGLREAYIDLFAGPFDVRLGKQQIIWGKGEGVFITDVVSPKDMREFLLPDFDEIRIGVNALKTTYYQGSHSVELVFIPQFTPTLMPESGSIWRREPSFPVQPVIDSSQLQIPLRVNNSEIFAKYSLMSPVADINIMGGYMWDDDPSLHIDKNLDPQTGLLSEVTITPRHNRLTVAGAAFSTVLGDFVIRGDGAWYTGKHFVTVDPLADGGLTDKQYANYLMGVDYTLWDTYISLQFIQRVILDYDQMITEDEIDNMATLLINRKFLRETLTLELFSYVGFNAPDALLRPKITYNFADGIELQLGVNVFLGDTGRFGQFSDNDMVYVKTRFSF